MTKVTIFGAGITGMSIASQLPRNYEITIVARDLPGDDPTQQWCSPWACAGWVALGGTPLEQKMQLDSLAYCSKLAKTDPESSIRCSELTDLHEVGATSAKELWYHEIVPGYQELNPAQLPNGQTADVAVKYNSFTLTPAVFLPWLRSRLETTGVTFKRIETINSLGALSHFGHDILINASGLGSMTLGDVQDEKIITDRTYTAVVKSEFRGSFVRRAAAGYTYIFGRHDGTAVLGGISEPVGNKRRSTESTRTELVRMAHAGLPNDFPSGRVSDYTFVTDLEGIRPLRLPEVRVEKEVINGQNVIHAYGTTAGGYIYSFGLGREVARLVDAYAFTH
ncbi:unnamed protein product [Clonostachys rhizophaga]|uniref:FAD dependent oxidoreductase domain-containing protein n=1 Tax=Clonostachys rhizophaga TaxID=160324 RepID=A0A9N9YI94_9HYPO|nr:unnamed protein product [Clonostachys rhizophaga]